MPKPPLIAQSYTDLAALLAPKESRFSPEKLALYQRDPPAYVSDVLKVNLIDEQKEGLFALTVSPYRVAMKSATNIGKTFGASCAINWHYDCFDPSAAITTAPTQQHVNDVLWKQVRMQRIRAGLPMDFIGPVAPEMRTAPDHYAKGFTARLAEAFKGRHDVRMLFVIDEAVKVSAMFWDVIQTMFKPELGHAWLILFNPTDVGSRAYQEVNAGEWADMNGKAVADDHPLATWRPKWHVITVSALDHPNVTGTRSDIPGIPSAVSRAQIDANVHDWCERLSADAERTALDFEWPPGSDQWWRPGPEFCANCLGIWPDQSTTSVWSDSVWTAACKPVTSASFPLDELPEIGVDLAAQGSDMTAIHARWGCYSIYHEERKGLSGPSKKGKLIEVARELAEQVQKVTGKECNPCDIRMKIDDAIGGWDLVGHMREAGYNATPINSSQIIGVDQTRYPKMRSQLWFQTARKAALGLVKFGLLPKYKLAKMKIQAMAPQWSLDGGGRRCVEEKEKTKERIGISPDAMDAVNLSHLSHEFSTPTIIHQAREVLHAPQRYDTERQERQVRQPRRKLFGQGR